MSIAFLCTRMTRTNQVAYAGFVLAVFAGASGAYVAAAPSVLDLAIPPPGAPACHWPVNGRSQFIIKENENIVVDSRLGDMSTAVSYTHLTLPTKRIV